MNRIAVLLTALGLLVVVAVFYLFVFQPSREELADIEDRIASEQSQQTQLQQDIARLRELRETAPRVESELAVGEAIVPSDPALPALVRQLQAAADEAGMELLSLSTGRPTELAEVEEPGLSGIDISGQLNGSYFQMVDFLRRIEEPAITARGITWNSVTVTRADEAYPELQFALSGRAFAVIEEPQLPEAEADTAPDEAAEEAPADDGIVEDEDPAGGDVS